MTLKATKAKTEKWHSLKLKSLIMAFCDKLKSQSEEFDNIFANYLPKKKIIFIIHEETKKKTSTAKKQIISFEII